MYSGAYIKRARTYDIVPDPGSGFALQARLLGSSDLSNVVNRGPLETLAHDSLDPPAPFAGVQRSIGLGGRDIDALEGALAESDLFQPTPSGLYLRSDDFFWVGVASIGGRPAFDAWKYPFSRLDDLTLPQLLFAWDAGGMAINPPRQTSLIDIDEQATVENQYSRFTLVVVNGGFDENGTLF